MLPNIGPIELIVILIIALIVIGPGRLPDVGAALGKSIKEFRKASSDITEAATVDTSPLPPAAAASQAVPAAAIQQPPATAPVVAEAAAAPSPDAPSAAPAPTPELSQPAPTNPIIPAPIQVPPVDDDAARPPA
jgi:TatA/E family protein of Tat protein translocase